MHETKRLRHFASDNNSGICPEVWAALQEANTDHVTGYGDDPWTLKAKQLVRDVFETELRRVFCLQRHGCQFSRPRQPV